MKKEQLQARVEQLEAHLQEMARRWEFAAKNWGLNEAEERAAYENALDCKKWAGEKVK